MRGFHIWHKKPKSIILRKISSSLKAAWKINIFSSLNMLRYKPGCLQCCYYGIYRASSNFHGMLQPFALVVSYHVKMGIEKGKYVISPSIGSGRTRTSLPQLTVPALVSWPHMTHRCPPGHAPYAWAPPTSAMGPCRCCTTTPEMDSFL